MKKNVDCIYEYEEIRTNVTLLISNSKWKKTTKTWIWWSMHKPLAWCMWIFSCRCVHSVVNNNALLMRCGVNSLKMLVSSNGRWSIKVTWEAKATALDSQWGKEITAWHGDKTRCYCISRCGIWSADRFWELQRLIVPIFSAASAQVLCVDKRAAARADGSKTIGLNMLTEQVLVQGLTLLTSSTDWKTINWSGWGLQTGITKLRKHKHFILRYNLNFIVFYCNLMRSTLGRALM